VPTVNATLKQIIKEKDAGIRTGTRSMLALLEELQGQVRTELGKAALGSWDAYHLRHYLDAIEGQVEVFRRTAQAEAGGLLDTAWNQGKALVDNPLATNGIYTGFYLSTSVLDTLKDYTFHRIDGLSAAAWDRVKGELTLGVLGGKTPQEVAKAIGENLNDPSVFKSIADRAEVITKTEMGRVFSEASQLRMEQAAESVEGLEKQWLHAGHPKVARLAHVAASGQHVPVNEPFKIGGINMMYPRDPGAPLEETFNCG
jgi:hypothetical protein